MKLVQYLDFLQSLVAFENYACHDYGLESLKQEVLCNVQTRIQERQLVFHYTVSFLGNLPCSCWKISPGVKTGLVLGSLV